MRRAGGLDYPETPAWLLDMCVLIQAGCQHSHAVAKRGERLAEVADMVFDAAKHRVVVFVNLENMHVGCE